MCVVLFERVSLLPLMDASSKETDAEVHREKVANIIKKFRVNCKLVNRDFQQICLRMMNMVCYIAPVTDEMCVIIVVKGDINRKRGMSVTSSAGAASGAVAANGQAGASSEGKVRGDGAGDDGLATDAQGDGERSWAHGDGTDDVDTTTGGEGDRELDTLIDEGGDGVRTSGAGGEGQGCGRRGQASGGQLQWSDLPEGMLIRHIKDELGREIDVYCRDLPA